MTPEQKKQVTNALVAFVLDITNTAFEINRAEATALSAALDFLVKTDSPERLYELIPEAMIDSVVSHDLHKISKRFIKSKE